MPDYDLAVIGAGPGGYVAAIRAAQLGLRTAIIEKEAVGGLCLNWGCIPSKALLHAAEVANLARRGPEFGVTYSDLKLDMSVAIDRSRDVVAKFVAGVETLLKQNKVTLISGTGRLTGTNTVSIAPSAETIEAKNVLIATGAVTRSLPNLAVDGERIVTSREALALREAPASIVVVGGGAIGAELGYFYRSYGARVTIVELLDRLLPNEDEDVSRQLERSFRAQGIDVRTGTRVEGANLREGGVSVNVRQGEKRDELRAERVLVAGGFTSSTEDLGLEEAGVALDDQGWIKIDDYARTNVTSIWAAGDDTGRLLLAHVASQQGVTAVEKMAGLEPPPLDYDKMPRAVYCQPQVASLGLTEAQAIERGLVVRAARFPFRVNGKALALGETDGFAKVVAERETGAIVGWHMIGHGVTELLGEASLGSIYDVTQDRLAKAVHAHPTLSEALREAALALDGEAIHFFSPPR
jgi:dihydrolipoamide dehydrogenase